MDGSPIYTLIKFFDIFIVPELPLDEQSRPQRPTILELADNEDAMILNPGKLLFETFPQKVLFL